MSLLDKAYYALEEVESHMDGIEKKIVLLRIEQDELRIKIKRSEQEKDLLIPEVRKAKRNMNRMRREYESLKRAYFQQREHR